MSNMPSILPGHEVTFRRVKPKSVKMWESLHLAEFQSSAQAYAQAVSWCEWSASPLIGSPQYFHLVETGMIDEFEVRAAGVRVGPAPVVSNLTDIPAIIGNSAVTTTPVLATPAPTARRIEEHSAAESSDEDDLVLILKKGKQQKLHAVSALSADLPVQRAERRKKRLSGGELKKMLPLHEQQPTKQRELLRRSSDVAPGGTSAGTVTVNPNAADGRIPALQKRPINIDDINRSLGILGMGGGIFDARPNQYWVATQRRLVSGNETAIKRTDMWNWMVSCLEKAGEPGPYSYLTKQQKKYDALGLFCAISDVTSIQNPFSWNRSIYINSIFDLRKSALINSDSFLIDFTFANRFRFSFCVFGFLEKAARYSRIA